MRDIRPEEVYNLGAQSHVRVSFDAPVYTGDVTGLGTLRLLEAIRASGIETRYLPGLVLRDVRRHAAAAERADALPPAQPLRRREGLRLLDHASTTARRTGMFAVNGILFNHESPRRGETFVTRKVTRAVARIKAGLQDRLYLGNLDAVRDWGYAPEYVEAMWRMLQHEEPTDYVVATGVAATVREFVETAFSHVGLDWASTSGRPKHERPSEVDALIGDPGRARQLLDWKPSVLVAELAGIMVDADLRQVEDQLAGAPVRIDR